MIIISDVTLRDVAGVLFIWLIEYGIYKFDNHAIISTRDYQIYKRDYHLSVNATTFSTCWV